MLPKIKIGIKAVIGGTRAKHLILPIWNQMLQTQIMFKPRKHRSLIRQTQFRLAQRLYHR